jgi:hypothetical protein
MTFKLVVCVAVGLVLGFALGGIPARRELATLRDERDALKAQLADASRPNLFQALLPGLIPPRGEGFDARRPPADRPGGGDPAGARREGKVDPRPEAQGDVVVIGADRGPAASAQPVVKGAEPSNTDAPAPSARGEEPTEGRRSNDRAPRDPDAMLERFDQLVTAQRMRSAAARTALVEQAGLKPEELQRVDTAVSRMNDKLEGYGEEVISQAASEKPPTPSQALGLGHDVSGILYDGQQELESVVGERAQEVDPKALEIWNYVDVEQWRPYVEKELEARSQGTSDGPGPTPAPSNGQAGAAPPPP